MQKKWYIFIFSIVCITSVCTVSNAGSTVLNTPEYKAEEVSYDDGGFSPLFNLARNFINLALPKSDQLMQDVIDIISGRKSVDLDYLINLVKGTFLSYSICIAVGLLFFIIFPLVGCCFCCCRVFCQCCCAKPEEEDPKASCKKKIYSMFLFMLVAVTAAGNICVYVSNDRISKAIVNIETTVTNNLDDVNTFIDYTLKQVDSIIHNFNDTKRQVHHKLDPNLLNKTLSDEALRVLTTGAVGNLQQEVNVLTNAVDGINKEYATLKTACKNLGQLLCDESKLPNISIPIPTTLKDIQGEVTKTLQSRIGSTVTNVAAQFKTANKELDDISGTVYSSVSSIKSVLKNLNGFDTDSIKDTVKTYVTLVKPYEKYRWYAGIGCAGMFSLILSLHLFGMLCGACGGCGSGDDPTDKGCLSNSGGRMMIASDVFLFPFCTILMLVTTVMFVPGSLLERYLCQPLTDPDLKVFDTVLNDFVDLDSILKYDSGFKPTFGKLLRNCQNNEAVYTAFNVEHLTSVNVNLTEVEGKVKGAENNIRQSINNTLGSLFTNSGAFANVSLLPLGLSNDMKKLGSINVTTIKSQLDAIGKMIPNTPLGLTSVTSDVEQMDNSQKKMDMHFQTLSDSQKKIGNLVTAVTQQLNNATTILQTTGMAKIAKSFVDSIFNTVDIFLHDTVDTVRNKFGQCRPVWNLYNSVIDVSVCKYCVDSFNGFWFSIGWSIFFLLPTAVFGTKLSNLIRDVDYCDEMDSVDGESGRNNYDRNISSSSRNSLSKKMGRNRNKVWHRDI